MSGATLAKKALIDSVLVLFDEAYVGPQGTSSWFADSGPGTGILGTLEGVDPAAASRPLRADDPLSAASHVGHVRYALSLANRAAKGENPYKDADWSKSWDSRKVDAAEWKVLVAGLRKEYEEMRAALAEEKHWDDPDFVTGLISLIGHGAWHLGALRQGLGLVKAPRN